MLRPPHYRLSHLLLLAMVVSSCTCGSEAPPPPTPVPTHAPAVQAPGTKPTATRPAAPSPTGAAAAAASPTTAADLQLPSNFPKDITVMEGSTLAGVQKLGGGAQNVLFTTDVETNKAFDYYKDDLKQKGHEITQQYQTGEQSFLSFKKGNQVTNVVIAKDPRDPKKKIVAIMYYDEQPADEF